MHYVAELVVCFFNCIEPVGRHIDEFIDIHLGYGVAQRYRRNRDMVVER